MTNVHEKRSRQGASLGCRSRIPIDDPNRVEPKKSRPNRRDCRVNRPITLVFRPRPRRNQIYAGAETKSNSHRCPSGFDFIQLVQPPLAAPGALLAGAGPIFRRFQVAVPEGPSTALTRALFVDFAMPLLVVKKNTVSIAEFLQRAASPDSACVLIFKFLDG